MEWNDVCAVVVMVKLKFIKLHSFFSKMMIIKRRVQRNVSEMDQISRQTNKQTAKTTHFEAQKLSELNFI